MKEVKKTIKMEDEDVEQINKGMQRNNELRSDSGNIEYEDTLTSFLYVLLRDHVTAGEVEKLVREVACEKPVIIYSNGFLAQYANNLANFLKNVKTNSLTKALESAFDNAAAAERMLKKHKKKSNIGLDGDEETLQELKEKVDTAIDNMTEEDKSKLKEKEEMILDLLEEDTKEKAKNLEEARTIKAGEEPVVAKAKLKPFDVMETGSPFKSEILSRVPSKELPDEAEENIDGVTCDEVMVKTEHAITTTKFIKIDDADSFTDEEPSRSVGRFNYYKENHNSVERKAKENLRELAKRSYEVATKHEELNKEVKDENEEKIAGDRVNEETKKLIDDGKFVRKKGEGVVAEIVDEVNDPNRQEWLEQNSTKNTISCALASLDKIKKVIPSDSVEQIIDILKKEINEELTDEAKEDIQTRESILMKRVEENAEHKSSEEGAEEKAVEFIKVQVAEQIRESLTHTVGEEDPVSRGKLKDVGQGRAFPEALDKVFTDNQADAVKKDKIIEEKMEQFRAGQLRSLSAK